MVDVPNPVIVPTQAATITTIKIRGISMLSRVYSFLAKVFLIIFLSFVIIHFSLQKRLPCDSCRGRGSRRLLLPG